MSEVVRAAGGLVWRRGEHDVIEVVLVHRPAYDDWAFPKGKLEDGETEEECAIREVTEETGLVCALGRGLGTTSYRDARGRPKTVRYWEMTAIGGELAADNEIDEARWVPLGEACTALSYDRDREVLARFGVAPPVPVHVIRHAKAASSKNWDGPDALRPLNKAGRRHAAGLVDTFDGDPLTRLVSSPVVRCLQTLEPLAKARGLAVETADELAEGAGADAALGLIRSLAAAGPAAVCTHGDVMQEVVQELASAGVPLKGGLLDLAKGSTWVVEVEAGSFTRARYVPPAAV